MVKSLSATSTFLVVCWMFLLLLAATGSLGDGDDNPVSPTDSTAQSQAPQTSAEELVTYLSDIPFQRAVRSSEEYDDVDFDRTESCDLWADVRELRPDIPGITCRFEVCAMGTCGRMGFSAPNSYCIGFFICCCRKIPAPLRS